MLILMLKFFLTLFKAQMQSRHLDLMARILKQKILDFIPLEAADMKEMQL